MFGMHAVRQRIVFLLAFLLIMPIFLPGLGSPDARTYSVTKGYSPILSNDVIWVPDNYTRIQWAIGNATEGDIVRVRAGIYNGQLVVDKALALIGEDSSTTVIDSDGASPVVELIANGSQISGFTVQDNKKEALYGIRLAYTSDCIINRNIVNMSYSAPGGAPRGIWLGNSNNTVISENVIVNGFKGIDLVNSNNNTIGWNNISDINTGINLHHSSNNTLNENILASSGNDGIWLSYSNNNTIKGNTANNGYDGIHLYSSDGNIIYGNTVKDNSMISIRVEYSDNNTVCGNTVAGSTYGIRVRSASGNIFYHNNFMNNVNTTYSLSLNTFWDNGYPSGGNYWSSYAGVDLYSGVYQNGTGSDGIGDTPHTIDENNRDNYPLVTPWSPHDIAIISVAASANVAYPHWYPTITPPPGRTLIPFEINVTVKNEGDFDETFNVTILYNNETLETEAVSLASAASTTLTLIWDVSNLSLGTYIMVAEVPPLPDETWILDNVIDSLAVDVRHPGNTNGDDQVSIADVGPLVIAWKKKPGQLGWDPRCDFNMDGEIDTWDVSIIIFEWGAMP